ncbi:leucine-rich repeat receptor-like tyrosine-protein kinase PXC3, partial [Tanacetum coccineum]
MGFDPEPSDPSADSLVDDPSADPLVDDPSADPLVDDPFADPPIRRSVRRTSASKIITSLALVQDPLDVHLRKMSRYLFYFLLSLLVFKYVSCDELPSSLVATMNKLDQVLGNHTKWNPSTNPCSWSGVSCTSNNTSITKLSLASLSISNGNVDNSWSSLVCDIPTLESLDISNNQLNLIPRPFLLTSCGAGGLKALNVSNNGLTGSLPTFQGPLEVLDLSRNSFDNVFIDSQIDGLNELRSLNISNCKFRGSVPTKL